MKNCPICNAQCFRFNKKLLKQLPEMYVKVNEIALMCSKSQTYFTKIYSYIQDIIYDNNCDNNYIVDYLTNHKPNDWESFYVENITVINGKNIKRYRIGNLNIKGHLSRDRIEMMLNFS